MEIHQRMAVLVWLSLGVLASGSLSRSPPLVDGQ